MKQKKTPFILVLIALCCLFSGCGAQDVVEDTARIAIEESLLAFEELSRQAGVIAKEELQKYADILPLDITVRAGILDFDLGEINLTTAAATADYSFVTWDVRILCEGGSYDVAMTYNKNQCTAKLSLTEGAWTANDRESYQKDIAPENYNTVKGTYDTFEEAVTAAYALDPAAENPF